MRYEACGDWGIKGSAALRTLQQSPDSGQWSTIRVEIKGPNESK
jgi:hypothetical protein